MLSRRTGCDHAAVSCGQSVRTKYMAVVRSFIIAVITSVVDPSLDVSASTCVYSVAPRHSAVDHTPARRRATRNSVPPESTTFAAMASSSVLAPNRCAGTPSKKTWRARMMGSGALHRSPSKVASSTRVPAGYGASLPVYGGSLSSHATTSPRPCAPAMLGARRNTVESIIGMPLATPLESTIAPARVNAQRAAAVSADTSDAVADESFPSQKYVGVPSTTVRSRNGAISPGSTYTGRPSSRRNRNSGDHDPGHTAIDCVDGCKADEHAEPHSTTNIQRHDTVLMALVVKCFRIGEPLRDDVLSEQIIRPRSRMRIVTR